MRTLRPSILLGLLLVASAVLFGLGAHPASDRLSATPANVTITREGWVVWSADASKPVQDEWSNFATQTACAVRTGPGVTSARVAVANDGTSPSPTGKFYRVKIVMGDDCYGARAEVAQGNPVKWANRLFVEGDNRWISWAVRLGPAFPTATNAWQVISQWKQTTGYPGGSYGGSPKFAMEVWGHHWYMNFTSNDPADQWNTLKGAHRVTFGGRPVTNRWLKFTMHVVFSDNPGIGTFALYGDMGDGRGWRTLIAPERTPTLLKDVPRTGLPVPSHLRMGIYRNATAYTGDTSIDFAGVTVATTRAAAEGYAFGRPAALHRSGRAGAQPNRASSAGRRPRPPA